MHDAAYMGVVASTAMHDLLNVFSTIKETAGLMDDLLCMGKGNFVHQERFLGLLKSIREQVQKGGFLAEELNRFGHLYEDGETHDAARLARMLLALLARKVAGHGLAMHVADVDRPVCIQGPAHRFVKLLFQVVEACLETLPRGRQVRISMGTDAGQGLLVLDGVEAEALAELLQRRGALGPGFSQDVGGPQSVRLKFPLSYGPMDQDA